MSYIITKILLNHNHLNTIKLANFYVCNYREISFISNGYIGESKVFLNTHLFISHISKAQSHYSIN